MKELLQINVSLLEYLHWYPIFKSKANSHKSCINKVHVRKKIYLFRCRTQPEDVLLHIVFFSVIDIDSENTFLCKYMYFETVCVKKVWVSFIVRLKQKRKSYFVCLFYLQCSLILKKNSNTFVRKNCFKLRQYLKKYRMARNSRNWLFIIWKPYPNKAK